MGAAIGFGIAIEFVAFLGELGALLGVLLRLGAQASQEFLQFAAVKPDAAAIGAYVNLDFAALNRLHRRIFPAGTDQKGHGDLLWL
jgi:hypothetical protein